MKLKLKKHHGRSALQRIQKLFPQVTEVVDSKESIRISVTSKDSQTSRKKDPEGCALAKACVRQNIADHAIIGIAFSYLINKTTAIRYKTSTGVAREITSFDRHQDFAEGKDYMLSKISNGNKIGKYEDKRERTLRSHREGKATVVHKTANIREINY